MSNKNFRGSNGKGYYIALVLCAVAIGISGYLYYRNADSSDPQLRDPDASAGAALDPTDDVQAVVADPQQTQPQQTDATTPSTVKKPMKTAAPLAGETVSPYAMAWLSYNQTTRDWRTHNGVDIAAEAGTAVTAAADGTVYTVYADETMGMTVVIRHEGGYTTSYASLAEDVKVAPGDTVTMGQTIGYVGRSALLESAIGDHLHFAVSCNDQSVDPAEFLAQN